MKISHYLVKIDQFSDPIPFASTITNLVVLFQKCVILPFLSKATIQANHYYKHIDDKSFFRCLVLLVPVIGNVIVRIYDFSNQGKVKAQHDQKLVAEYENLDNFLKTIKEMNQKQMDDHLSKLNVNNREDYIKCMLTFAIKAEKFHEQDVDMSFHDAIEHFQQDDILKDFVHEDIRAGRKNQKTLLHEILSCKPLSAKAKGSAFYFMLRDGHDYLRDYLGNREENFTPVQWGDSLKEIFNEFSTKEKSEFFTILDQTTKNRLKAFTGIKAS